jgi:hypothetical protein
LDAEAVIAAVIALQLIQTAQLAVLGRTVKRSMRPPPPSPPSNDDDGEEPPRHHRRR